MLLYFLSRELILRSQVAVMYGVRRNLLRLASKSPSSRTLPNMMELSDDSKIQCLGPERTVELKKLCCLPDIHANDCNETPFNISQIDRTRARPLSAVLAGRPFVITLHNHYC